jgi:thioredoxin-related protein
MISTSFNLDVIESMRLDHANPIASGRRTRSGGAFVRIYLAAAVYLFLSLFLAVSSSKAGENLKINPKLDYTSDSNDGPLITGDHMDAGAAADRVNYVLVYGEGCYNSKRQARRTVALYEKYRGRVNFVIVELDKPLSSAQSELVKNHFTGSIPHVVVLDKTGKAVYDTAGEVSEQEIGDVLDKALAR